MFDPPNLIHTRHCRSGQKEIFAPTLKGLASLLYWFFCKTIYSFHKNGTKKYRKTNHYILLTNVSIKRCIRPILKPISSGGEEFQPDKYLTDRIKWISMSFIFQLCCVFRQTILLQNISYLLHHYCTDSWPPLLWKLSVDVMLEPKKNNGHQGLTSQPRAQCTNVQKLSVKPTRLSRCPIQPFGFP